jgi:ABC-type transport system involved in multi-copper enzyme maturation permease subunit
MNSCSATSTPPAPRGPAWSALAAVLRFTLIDVLRSRFAWLLAAVLATGWGIALFGAQLALTERQAISVALVAPLLRTLAAAMLTTLVAAATVREVADRTHLIALAAPVSRAQWLTAKFAAHALLAWAVALVCGLSMGLVAPLPAVLAWTLSLGLELMLSAALAMTAALALAQTATAVLATFAVYVASRCIGVIVLLNARMPLADSQTAGRITGGLLEALGLVLPRLDLFTRTDWLAGGPITGLGAVLLQAVLYTALLLAVATFDLARDDA